MSNIRHKKYPLALATRFFASVAGGNAVLSSLPKLFPDNSDIIEETYLIIPSAIVYISGLILFIGGIFIIIEETSQFATLTLFFPVTLSLFSKMIFDEEIRTWPIPAHWFAGMLAVIVALKNLHRNNQEFMNR